MCKDRTRNDIETRFRNCDEELHEYYGETFNTETQQRLGSFVAQAFRQRFTKK
ncbi:hypothetical protein DPMN_058916 [Dreissena polymorpha]|uniref:Uncharacterized protein n=1 Tax=Dreissena polymorpha TaxID=45954 RepID=A0A9D4C301_DREPO|nr:hypothetical protein DPMN_058916 [Dreissena polymorpha]